MNNIVIDPFNVEYYLKEPYRKSGNRLAYSSPLGNTLLSQWDNLVYNKIKDNVFIIEDNEIVTSYIINFSEEAKTAFQKEYGDCKLSYVEEKDVLFFNKTFMLDESDYEPVYPISRFASFDVLGKERNLAKKFFEKYPNITLLKYDRLTSECKELLKNNLR